jgi:murein L,D-transpeptidase YafK
VKHVFTFFAAGFVLLLSLTTFPAQAQEVESFAVENRRPLRWAAAEPFFVVVERRCRTVTVYRHGVWDAEYRGAVFGREDGPKVHEGDRRTPNGLYRMQGRRLHPRWSRFLLLDYPNPADRAANQAARKAGTTDNGPGSAIGIHGTDEPTLNREHVDWTLGCISLQNADVDDLYSRVPEGTPVWIRP